MVRSNYDQCKAKSKGQRCRRGDQRCNSDRKNALTGSLAADYRHDQSNDRNEDLP